MNDTILGLDLGTGGLRAVIVADGKQQATARAALSRQHPQAWDRALETVLTRLHPWLNAVRHVIADATSSTVMLWDDDGPASPVRMYSETGRPSIARALATWLPRDSGAHGASSTLCKVLQLKARATSPHRLRIAHQIDWLNARLLGFLPPTDWNNALKLGFDPVTLRWPDEVRALLHPLPVPKAVAPGTPLGEVSPALCARWGFPRDCLVHAGTTDSIAAFLASGACRPGDAVVSLGSTLAIKLLDSKPLFDPAYGLYSHRLGDMWLIGGASNCGGRTLLKFFTPEQLEALTPHMDPTRSTGLDYYPLPAPGERFPINDPDKQPILTPRPDDPARFLQGLLEGLVKVERLGFERLRQLGAIPPRRIFCAGGGCVNPVWRALRAQALPAPLAQSESEEAALGVTRLLTHLPAGAADGSAPHSASDDHRHPPAAP